MFKRQVILPVDLGDIRRKLEETKDGDGFLRFVSNYHRVRSYKFKLIEKAHTQVTEDFAGIQRRDGVQYIEHLRGTAVICLYVRGDKNYLSIIERILHDWLEDIKGTCAADIVRGYHKVVAHTVEGVSEPDPVQPSDMSEWEFKRWKQALKFKKVERFGIRSMRVKVDDRLHNMLTLYGTPEDKRKKIIETLEWVLPYCMKDGNVLLPELIAACTEQLERLHIDDWHSLTT